jgi:hypothetical protein
MKDMSMTVDGGIGEHPDDSWQKQENQMLQRINGSFHKPGIIFYSP